MAIQHLFSEKSCICGAYLKKNIGKNNYFHIKRFFSYVAPKYSDFVFILLLKLVHMSKFPLVVMGVIQESSVGHSRIIQESFGSQSGIIQESSVSHQGIIWELESSKNHNHPRIIRSFQNL